jgi:uncharacterized protein YneF (UPF0154 family)
MKLNVDFCGGPEKTTKKTLKAIERINKQLYSCMMLSLGIKSGQHYQGAK